MTSGEKSDQELIQAARQGDARAFEALVWRHQRAVRTFMAVRLGNAWEAEDLAQEVFILAWRKIDEFEPGGFFLAWLRTIGRNLVLNHRRKFRAQAIGGNHELEALMETPYSEFARDLPERVDALRQCLEEVGGPARALLEGRYRDGFSLEELGRLSGRGSSAISMQLHRLRKILADCVERNLELPSKS